jgi:hypothetical protein
VVPSARPPVVDAPSRIACAKPKFWMLLPSMTSSTTSQPPLGIVTAAGVVNGNVSVPLGPPNGCGAALPLSGR